MSGCDGRLVGLVGLAALGLVGGCGISGANSAGGVQGLLAGGPATQATSPLPSAVDVPGCEAADCRCLAAPSDADHAALFELLNAYRLENDLEPLAYSRRLQLAADRHAQRMAAEGFFDHVAPDGTTVADRAAEAGYCHQRVGENIAYGLNSNDTADEVMAKFQASHDHDRNMLWTTYRYVGIGVHRVQSERGTEYWWVQMLSER